ncbi:MAG: hypothetical protein PHC95_05020 [Parabacteroides sp.]|nr:hypothetical protein [Parabacteroides sp.]
MWTCETFKEFFEKEKVRKIATGHYGSDPTFLFNPDGSFNQDNWNGSDLIRRYALHCWDGDIIDDRVKVGFACDDWTVIIKINKDTYVIEWYKSRGRTDRITKNKKPITLSEYVELLNILEIENF